MGDQEYNGGERRAEERERTMLMDKLAGAVETMVKQSGEQSNMINDVLQKVGELNTDVQKVIIHQKNFNKVYDKQVSRCSKVHDDHEERLRNIPEHKCLNERRIETLETDSKDHDHKIYKIMGIFAVIMVLITIFAPVILKKAGWT